MVSRLRSGKQWLWLFATAFLWMQLATATYACPRPGGAGTDASALMPDCDAMSGPSMDGQQPNLCKAHCDKDKQRAAADHSLFDGAAVAAGAPGPSWPTAVAEPGPWSATAARGSSPTRGAPPLFITFLVLRN
jgi:hypothetical protein